MVRTTYLLFAVSFLLNSAIAQEPELPPELRDDPVVSEPFEDDLDAVQMPMPLTPAVENRLEKLEDWAKKTAAYLNKMNERILTEEQVREIVRDEFAQLTIKEADGKITKKTISVNEEKTSTFGLPEGAVITHINGVPVERSTYYSSTVKAPVTRYVSPSVEIRQYSRGRGIFGFLRPRVSSSSGSCRIVNGVQVCN